MLSGVVTDISPAYLVFEIVQILISPLVSVLDADREYSIKYMDMLFHNSMTYYFYAILKFEPIIDEPLFLLPPSVQDFILSNHLSRIISEVVDSMDTSVIEEKYSHLGQKAIRLNCC